MDQAKLILLKPHLEFKIWGGDKIRHFKKLSSDSFESPIGEAWEISCHPSGKSFNDHNEEIQEGLFPYLVKLIDTSDNLSVQVHPGDEYAKKYEESKGKAECWLIVEAEDNAGIFLGFKEGVTKKEFEDQVENNGSVQELLVYYKVKPGDFFYVPPGSIHAIGKGVTLVEVQQSSGITYRVWDWNRLDDEGRSRELHIKKAMDVCEFSRSHNCVENFKIQKELFDKNVQKIKLLKHSEFEVDLYQNIDELKVSVGSSGRVESLYCLEGIITINVDEQMIKLDRFSSCLLNCSEDVVITCQEGSKFIHIS